MATSTLPPNRFYVYLLFRADGRPLYVGKGHGRRWLSHEQERELRRNLRKSNAIKIALAKLGDVPKVKIAENLTEAEAFNLERIFIEAIGRAPDGPLANLATGGEGQSGWHWSDEGRAKMSASRRGVKKSVEHRRKIAAAHTGKKRPYAPRHAGPDEIERTRKMGLANRGKIPSAETRQKMSTTRSGRKWGKKQRDNSNRRIFGDQLTLPLE